MIQINIRYAALLRKIFPFLRWKHRVNRETAQADLIAGLTGAALVLPQGVAFATIAGMPPEYGLYASMVPAIVAALFGSSWHLVSGPTTAASIVMFSALSAHAAPGSEQYIALAITLTFMVGVIQLVMGMARLGTLVNFISHSVIVGFTAGAAILIMTKQADNFFGLKLPLGEHFYETLYYLWTHWTELHPLVSLVAIVTLVTGIVVKLRWPKFPSMLAALIIGSLTAVLLNLVLGEATTGVQMVGALPRQLPPLSIPEFSVGIFRELAPVALAMTLFALTEAVSIARSISMRSGQPIEGNQEFIGQGLSNIAGSFFSAYVATGSFNRSGANYDAGARTPLAAVFAGILLLVVVLLFAPLTAYLPKAAMAGLLFLVAWRLIDFHHIKSIMRADRKETLVMSVTFFGTLFLELEFAILLGVMLSLMIYLSRTSKPKVVARAPDPDSPFRQFASVVNRPECPQLKLIRIDDSLYFGAVAYVREMLRRIREHYPEQKHLLLLTKGINHVDIAGAELLMDEATARREMGGELYLYRLKDAATDVLERGGYMQKLNRANMYDSKTQAINSIFNKLDKSICERCDKRIFLECSSIKS
ncbi:MAG: SulP family inorganic anion transporter [Gammaproteobacteria bacterium]|nr:SulP family inorganic anion transporter [Gammaproteobacteria bacterium]